MRKPISRRAVLRGAAGGLVGTLALPRLEAMMNGHGTAYADGTALPKVFVVWFWGNGIDPKRWVPQGTGTAWTPSEQLAPLAGVKDYLSVVTNHRLRPPRTNEPHVNGPVGILTGDDFMGNNFRDGTVKRPSIDQVVATAWKPTTKLRSLEVRVGGYHGGGTAIDHISHNGPNNPNRGEADPKAVFDRLFGVSMGGATVDPEIELRKNAIDLVMEDVRGLRARVGAADRARLDQHLEAVNGIARRLQPQPTPAGATCARPAAPVATMSLRERSALMSKLVAAALSCDLTRVATFEFTTPAAHVQYPDIGVREDIHEWGHTHGVDPIVQKAILYFMENLSAFLGALKATGEGTGNLLDRACVFGTSCTAYGPSHQYADWPLLLAGRAGGALRPGVHVRPATEDNAAKVPLTILKALGVPGDTWGVGTLMADKVVSELLS